jgi:hypothetical protein
MNVGSRIQRKLVCPCDRLALLMLRCRTGLGSNLSVKCRVKVPGCILRENHWYYGMLLWDWKAREKLHCLYKGADKSLARTGRKQATATEDFWVSYILFIIIIGGILVLYIYNKTSIKRNIPTIKQNTSGSRSGWGIISTYQYFISITVQFMRAANLRKIKSHMFTKTVIAGILWVGLVYI